MINWYGDFVPDNGAPARRDVPLENNFMALHLGQSIPVAVIGDNPGRAFATWEWLPLAIIGTVSAALAGVAIWLVIHDLRRPRPPRTRTASI
jgi:hypothetical protein